MNRKIVLLSCVLFLFACGLAGCGKSEGKGQEAAAVDSYTAEIGKDGIVTSNIEEAFASEYYDEESLKEFILMEAGRYNSRVGEDRITVKKLEVKKDTARLTMQFQSAEDFAAFNGYTMFSGTVAEAYEAGFDLQVTLDDVDTEGDVITRDQLLEMGSRGIVIIGLQAGERLTVKTSGKILYQSGAESVEKATAVISGDGASPVYLVYKQK
ncbi:hypothetical protein V1224_09975 [Lachnospiraceae bacterium JLR.KK008]